MDINDKELMVIYGYQNCIQLYSNKNYIDSLGKMNIIKDKIIGSFPMFPESLSKLIKNGKSFHEYEVEMIRF